MFVVAGPGPYEDGVKVFMETFACGVDDASIACQSLVEARCRAAACRLSVDAFHLRNPGSGTAKAPAHVE
jgi:hypothetical protein